MKDSLPRPRLLTFDCYGTLIDWRTGILDALRGGLPEAAKVGDEPLFSAYLEVEAAVQDESYRPYREVLAESARRLARRFGWGSPEDGGWFLPDSLPGWPAFPDSTRGLRRLSAGGFSLGILSNVDRDLLETSIHTLGIDIPLRITAEDVGRYKPHPAHFERALEEVGGQRDHLLHVAQSHFHDVQAAMPLGIRTLWVNRGRTPAPGPPPPTAMVDDLDGAATWILERWPRAD